MAGRHQGASGGADTQKNGLIFGPPLALGLKDSPAKRLLDSDEDVARWHANLARASELTAGSRLRRLNMFYKNTGLTPAKLAAIGKENAIRAEDMILDYVTWMESQNYAPGYIEDVVKALKSWLSYNYVDVRRRIRVANARVPVTLDGEQVPTAAQLESIMNAADARTRASMGLMAFAGLRPQVIGNHDGTDGLRVADIEGLDAGDGTAVSVERTPAMVTVRPQISKAGHRYFTFLTSQGCGYLLAYLRCRMLAGERLSPDSPLISRKGAAARAGSREGGFLGTKSVTLPMRRAIRSVLMARPYVLRAYFDTQLLVAESNGCMTHAYRQFFMGHTGDMEARYTTNKGRLTGQMIEDMRGSFARSEPFLRAGNGDGGSDRTEAFLQAWRQQARIYGIDPSRVSIRGGAGNGGGGGAAAQDGGVEAMPDGGHGPPPPADAGGRPYMTEIISGEEALLEYVSRGWDPVRDMGDGRMLVRIRSSRPSSA